MGQQHYSHVANATHETIKVVLTDSNNRETSQIIEPNGNCCIPTSQGYVTLSVFQLDGNNFMSTPIAKYTNESDRSFIVKTVGNGYINVSSAKYGSVWSEESGPGLPLMGQQHNSHVANATHETIKIVLTGANNRETWQIIEPHYNCCIPTSQGNVTLSVFKQNENKDNFMATPIATYTNDSDRSFIVKAVGNGCINVCRAKYGTVWQEEMGIQNLDLD